MELVRILYGYLFRGLEYLLLCRILVWNDCLVWLWSSMEDKFVRPEKFQFLEKGQNRNFDYKIVISVKNP